MASIRWWEQNCRPGEIGVPSMSTYNSLIVVVPELNHEQEFRTETVPITSNVMPSMWKYTMSRDKYVFLYNSSLINNHWFIL